MLAAVLFIMIRRYKISYLIFTVPPLVQQPCQENSPVSGSQDVMKRHVADKVRAGIFFSADLTIQK